MSYFGAPGQPPRLTAVPLEEFAAAIGDLARRPGVDPARVALWGVSRGSEAALLTAADRPDLVDAVIAQVPSSVIHSSASDPNAPAWTRAGTPVPYAPVADVGQPAPADAPASIIPVDRVRGPILTICAGRDTLWPSCPYSAAIAGRAGCSTSSPASEAQALPTPKRDTVPYDSGQCPASFRTAGPPERSGRMTTYVLVHGAWQSGQVWSRVVPGLAATGSRVLTPTLTGYGETRHLAGPGVGLGTHVRDVVDLISDEDLHDVVLVGHSYAGMVISAVANRVPDRIARLVYLDAMVPRDGESAVDVMPMSAALVESALAGGDGWRVPPLPELPAPHGLFGVTDADDVAWLGTLLSDQPVACLQERVILDNPAAERIPRTHVHCTVKPDGFERRPVAPTQPDGEPAHVVEFDTGHSVMITMPDALVALLRTLGG